MLLHQKPMVLDSARKLAPRIFEEGRVVLDDLIPVDLDQACLVAANRLSWTFGRSARAQNAYAYYWHHQISYGEADNQADIFLAARDHPQGAFAELSTWQQQRLVADATPVRSYLNAHTYGTDGFPLLDCQRPRNVT